MTMEEAIESLQNFADHAYPNEEFLMAIEALEQIKRLSKLLNELDLDDLTSAEYDEMFPKQSINDLKDELWRMYCFAEDVWYTINMKMR